MQRQYKNKEKKKQQQNYELISLTEKPKSSIKRYQIKSCNIEKKYITAWPSEVYPRKCKADSVFKMKRQNPSKEERNMILSTNAEKHLTKYNFSSCYDCGKLTFVKWSTGWEMVSGVSK